MSNDFNWQTEDDGSWEEAPQAAEDVSRSRRFVSWLKRRKRRVSVGVFLLLVFALTAYYLINRRIEQAEEALKKDVLAAHGLVRQAVFEIDYDLLEALMVDDDSDWVEYQLELLNLGLFLDRRPLGLKLIRDGAAAQTMKPGSALTVTLSPDLQTAEVVEQFPYVVTGGEQISETVWLEQTFFYRRQAGSWLLKPISDDEAFWGGWQNLEAGDNLTLVFPRREETLALSLAGQTQELIGRICRDSAIICPDDFNLEIRLSRDEQGLLSLNESVFDILMVQQLGRFHFVYPTPTMVGRPVDEAGQEALFRGYANWLAAVLAFRFDEEGRGGLVLSESFEENLAGWGLEPPPEPSKILPIPEPIAQPPIPFPKQDILLTCTDLRELTMLRYNPRANEWIDELRGRETTYLSSQWLQSASSLVTALPDDSGVLITVSQFDGGEDHLKLVLWRNGQEQLWLESEFTLLLPPESIQHRFDPGGRNLILFDNIVSATSSQIIPYAINIDDCLSGNCEMIDYEGFPYWSPDSSWLLAVDREEQDAITLWNVETGEETALGAGFSPVWVDDETFYYLRAEGEPDGGLENPSNAQMIEATVSDPLSGTVLFESADIANVINLISSAIQDDTPDLVSVSQAIVNPRQPDWFFLTATLYRDAGRSTNYLLGYRRDTGEITLLMALDAGLPAAVLEVVQDGRYLSVPVFGQMEGGSRTDLTFNLLPLEPKTMSVGSGIERYEINSGLIYDWSIYDWSSDGRWLLNINEDEFRLIAPGHDYDQAIPYNLDQYCEAVWIIAP